MRNGLGRSGQPLRNSPAHAVVRNELVASFFVERANLLIAHCRRDGGATSGRTCGRRGRRAQTLALLRRRYVAGDDAAMRTRAGNAAELDAGVLGETARERRGEDTVGA